MRVNGVADKAQYDELETATARIRPGLRFAATALLKIRCVFGCGESGGSNTAGEQTGDLVPAAARLTMFTDIRQLMHTVDWPIWAAPRRDYGHSYMSNGGRAFIWAATPATPAFAAGWSAVCVAGDVQQYPTSSPRLVWQLPGRFIVPSSI
jgi:hypothetical protein